MQKPGTVPSGTIALAVIMLLAGGCGAHSPSLVTDATPDKGKTDGGGGIDSGAKATNDAGPLFRDDAGSGPSDASDDCPEAAKLVYVTGEGGQLWSFYPPTFKFTLIGTLSCTSAPTHMTIDRQGSAWVVAGGQLYKASTKDATCAPVPTWSRQLGVGDFSDFALTFVGTNAVDNTLYLMGPTSLGTFDVLSGTVATISSAPAPNAIGDMTSNGDGKLYFLHDLGMPTLYELDPTTGATISMSPLGVSGGGAQALAFWGGAFYAFENSVAYQYDVTKKTATSIGNAPLSVTGAGQSTCVPKTMPPVR